MSAEAENEGTVLGQGFIVALLVGGMMLLYSVAPADAATRVAPTAMLALGFVVLTSFTVGHLAEVLGLPHITGYLVAGVLLGASFASWLPPWAGIPPFDTGVLDEDVIDQLGLLDALAVALIALTAGGELKVETLRKGVRQLAGVLGGQAVMVMIVGTLFVWLVSGATLPGVVLPGLDAVGTSAAIALGVVVASISLATSPAATIAVINGADARGPMTRLVLSTVVLKDVIVVVVFSLASAWAARALGIGGGDDDLATFLAVHIGGSLVAGGAIGLGTALYLRWVDREVLLFLVGVVYLATYVARGLHLDPVLLFIAAGFTASNFSEQGERLVREVEKLSAPVYVVFFTLAGARLHLDEVVAVAPFAVTLVATRVAAYALGVSVGARLGGADAATRRYGWLGFVSQAGVAISLSALVGARFGEVGRSLETLLIAGVALNELLGPVLLKVGLGLAGEIPKRPSSEPRESSLPPPAPAPASADSSAFGERSAYRSPELSEAVSQLVEQLRKALARFGEGELADRHEDGDHLLGELRRDVLRMHRRLLVAARDADLDPSVLATEEAALYARLRDDVRDTIDEMRREKGFDVLRLADALDGIAERSPETFEALYEPAAPPEWWRGALAWLTRRGEPRRTVPFRELARHHLSGLAVARLPDLAARVDATAAAVAPAFASALDRTLAAYRRALGDGTGSQKERIDALTRARRVADAAVDEARTTVASAFRTIAAEADAAVGATVEALEADLVVLGTRELSPRSRRSSLVFRQRTRALAALEDRAADAGQAPGAELARVVVELELRRLGLRFDLVRAEEIDALVTDVRGRTATQLERLVQELERVRPELEEAWTRRDGSRFFGLDAAHLREISEAPLRVMEEAETATAGVRERLRDPATVDQLVAVLVRAAGDVGESWALPAGGEDAGRVVDVPLHNIVVAELEGAVARELGQALGRAAEALAPLTIALRETRRLAVLNVDLAAAELEVAEDGEPIDDELLQQLVEPGIDRAETVATTHLEEARRLVPELRDELAEIVNGCVQRLRRELLETPLEESRLRDLRQEARPRATDGRTSPERGSAVGRWVAAARTLFGGGPETAPGPDARPGAAWKPVGSRGDLPLAYRRLFGGEALEAGEAALPGDLDAGTLAKRLAARSGRLRSLVLTGPPGVGKVAALRGIARSRVWREVHRLAFDGPSSPEAVDERLAEAREGSGRLIAIVGAEWLSRPGQGGAMAAETLVQHVLRDGGRNAWVACVDVLPWRQASVLTPLADAFPEVVPVQPLDEQKLREALLARHALSRYELRFHGTRSDADAQGFFEGLHRASGGRVRDALRLWIEAVDRIDEAGLVVHFGRVPASPEPALAGLDDDALLELHAFERWGWLDADGFAESFRLRPVDAEARLSKLAQVGLVERAAGAAFRTAAHLRGPVGHLFETRGWTR